MSKNHHSLSRCPMCRQEFVEGDFLADLELANLLKSIKFTCKCEKAVSLNELEYHESSECVSYT